MSAPTSLKMSHPMYIHETLRKRYFIFYLFHFWLSIIPSVFLEVGFALVWVKIPLWISILLIPLDLLLMYYLTVITAVAINESSFISLKTTP